MVFWADLADWVPKFYLYLCHRFLSFSFHHQPASRFLPESLSYPVWGSRALLLPESLIQHKVQTKQSVISSWSCNWDFLLTKQCMTSSRQCNSSFVTSWQLAQMFKTVKIKILFQNATSFSRVTEVLQASTAAAEGLLPPQGLLGALSTEDSRPHWLSHVTLSGSGTGKGGKGSPGFRNSTLLCKSSKRLPQLDTCLWKARIEKITSRR